MFSQYIDSISRFFDFEEKKMKTVYVPPHINFSIEADKPITNMSELIENHVNQRIMEQ